jgi:hypothetical protein
VPAFNRETDSDRLDYRLMIRSPIRLLYSRELLAEIVRWLREAGYEVVEVDASQSGSGRLLAARSVSYWVLTGFDVFANAHIDDARILLDTVAGPCWSSLVVGRRAMCLVQTDDPSLKLGRIGVWPSFLSDWELRAGR